MANKTYRYRFRGATSEDLTRLLGATAVVASPALGPTSDVTVDESKKIELDGIMADPYGFESLGEVSTPNIAIAAGVFTRAAGLVISSSDTHLAFDTTSTMVPANGVSLSGGNIVPVISGLMTLSVCAATEGTLLTATGLRLAVTYDLGGASQRVLYNLAHYAPAGQGPIAQCTVRCAVAAGKPIRVGLAMLGVASDDLMLTEVATFANVQIVSS